VVLKTGWRATTVNTVTDASIDPRSADEHRGAARFFWAVLILATTASIAGNITHAILKTGGGPLVWVAAAVAMVPPIVLLAATHSVGLLVRTRSTGPIYAAAVVVTVGLSGCAFALSFDALWELAIRAGVRRGIAWLWPLSVDMSIAQATIALLSLNRRRTTHPAAAAPGTTENRTTEPRTTENNAAAPAPAAAAAAVSRATAAHPDPQTTIPPAIAARVSAEVPSIANRRRENPGVRPLAAAPVSSATDWSDVAAALVRDGVTAKSPDDVAAVLALWEADTAPNTIAKRLGVHRDTVAKITAAAEDLLSAARIRA
jgi:hypothetical protein